MSIKIELIILEAHCCYLISILCKLTKMWCVKEPINTRTKIELRTFIRNLALTKKYAIDLLNSKEYVTTLMLLIHIDLVALA